MATSKASAMCNNTIEGDTQLKIEIYDITTADELIDQVLALGEQASRISSVFIDMTRYYETLDEAEELADAARKQLEISATNKDTSSSPLARTSVTVTDASTLCGPIITLLDLIKTYNGRLTSFTWPAPLLLYRVFTRPQSFWTALYAHAPTLVTLHLDFFCHEVHTLGPLPPNTAFPLLKTLQLDTSSAHAWNGCNGSTIDALLHASPHLESLRFEWPLGDLEHCQLTNISWAWTFPDLTHLHVCGLNIEHNHNAYNDFLVRHPGLTSLEERVDGPYDDEGGKLDARLPASALPNLHTLIKAGGSTHPLTDYFDTAANRPIHSLTLHVGSFSGIEQCLPDIVACTPAQTGLRSLAFRGAIDRWRDSIEALDSSSDDRTETPAERQIRKEKWAKNREERKKRRPLTILKKVLPSLLGLEELDIEMDSSHPSCESSGTWVCPEPMSEVDLRNVMGALTEGNARNLRILRMRDTRAKPLQQLGEVLRESEVVTGSLQVVEWCGEEKSVLRVSQIE
ncbi:hypothetical protein C7974DRAFT_408736 [Boeremia exigua]|uniref:uncharacterized protein n=1 Tax=Boeremia exigua TaxID=749465 RepID=UPI001E8E0F98|nr:uncharacterized protein C7974DRAFT_408736 [Boeremia exigua]KAH6642158.1 hypothetical protein C7974DRAFT_408736 [Boeremia exigua]